MSDEQEQTKQDGVERLDGIVFNLTTGQTIDIILDRQGYTGPRYDSPTIEGEIVTEAEKLEQARQALVTDVSKLGVCPKCGCALMWHDEDGCACCDCQEVGEQ